MFEKLFKALKPCMFNYKVDKIDALDTEKTFLGIMAQDIRTGLEAEGLDPDKFSVVQKQETGYYAVDYVQLIPVLVSKIKSLEDKITALEEKV